MLRFHQYRQLLTIYQSYFAFWKGTGEALPIDTQDLIYSFLVEDQDYLTRYNSLPSLWQSLTNALSAERIFLHTRIKALYKNALALIGIDRSMTSVELRGLFFENLGAFKAYFADFDPDTSPIDITVINILYYINKAHLKKLWFRVAREGNVELAGVLIGCGIDPNFQPHRQHDTALIIAATAGHEQLLELLLFANAYPNLDRQPQSRYFNRTTPLREAATHGKTVCVKRLLEKGALVSSTTIEASIKAGDLWATDLQIKYYLKHAGQTPETVLVSLFEEALTHEQLAIADLILRYHPQLPQGSMSDILLSLVREQKLKSIRYLLKRGVNHTRALYDAIRRDRRESLKVLLSFARNDFPTAEGNTIYHHLSYCEDKTFECITEEMKGENIDKVNAMGQTPLQKIGSHYVWPMIKRFHLAGAELSWCDGAGNSYLHYALEKHWEFEAINYLISKCPQLVNQANHNGVKPLSLALYDDSVMSLLIEKKATFEQGYDQKKGKKLLASANSDGSIELLLKQSRCHGVFFSRNALLKQYEKANSKKQSLLTNYWVHHGNIFGVLDSSWFGLRASFFTLMGVFAGFMAIMCAAGAGHLTLLSGLIIAGSGLIGPTLLTYSYDLIYKVCARLFFQSPFEMDTQPQIQIPAA